MDGQSQNGEESEGGGNSQDSNSQSDSEGSNSTGGQSSSSRQNEKYSMKSSGILTGDNSTINWENIKIATENLHPIWANIMIDLNAIQINSENILKFGSDINNLTTTVKKEDKQGTLIILSTLYAYLPEFLGQYSENTKLVNLMKTKANVLRAYQAIDTDAWDAMNEAVNTAQTEFLSVMNEANKEDENNNSLSKIYVFLNDLKHTIELKDKDLFLIKYRSLCEELNIYQEHL